MTDTSTTPVPEHSDHVRGRAEAGDFPRSAINLPSIQPNIESSTKFPLIHKLTASESVLAIEVDNGCLYAGLNTGDIAVRISRTHAVSTRLTHGPGLVA